MDIWKLEYMVNTFYEAPARFWSGSESAYKRDELITTSH